MWLLFAFGSALAAGVTAILAKIGIKKVGSNLATALRTIVVLVFAWIMVFITGSQSQIGDISGRTLLFLVLSGLATGASWLCYFRALQIGDVNKVTPVDKSSTVLTMILAFLFLGEPVGPLKLACMALIGIGTYLMIDRKRKDGGRKDTEIEEAGSHGKQGSEEGTRKAALHSRAWLLYAFLSAVFASLTSILGKVGISGVESNLGTAIRTIVVLAMAWVVVFVTGAQKELAEVDRKSALFLVLSGITTGMSWMCYYRALQDGPASVVVPIDKLSILVTVFFSWTVLKEKLSARSGAGLMLIVAGTLALLL